MSRAEYHRFHRLFFKNENYYNEYKLWKSAATFWGRRKLLRRWKVPKIIETQNLASIGFPKLDMLLKRRLYELSFPFIKRRLWMSSKSTSKLGKKPVTYVADRVIIRRELFAVPRFQNAVILCNSYVEFVGLSSADFRRILQYFDFQHTNIAFEHCQVDLEKHAGLFHPNLYTLALKHCNISFETALKIAPKVCRLRFYGNMPENWETMLTNWDNSFLSCCLLSPKKIHDFALLSSWIRQKYLFVLCISNHEHVKYNETELLESFSPVKNYYGKRLELFGRAYKLKHDSICNIL